MCVSDTEMEFLWFNIIIITLSLPRHTSKFLFQFITIPLFFFIQKKKKKKRPQAAQATPDLQMLCSFVDGSVVGDGGWVCLGVI